MVAKTLTGAGTIIMLSVPGLFDTPQQLQGFATDDIYDTDQIDAAETLMGVDGVLSGGYINVPVMQNFALQADSDSIEFFETWWSTNQSLQTVLTATGTTALTALQKKFAMIKGFLRRYKPMPDGKKLYQPQKFAIEWQQVTPSPS